MKESAVREGLNPRNYKAKSMRTTLISLAHNAGIERSEINKMAGLAPNSTVAARYYSMGRAGLTAALLMEIAPLNIDDVKARSAL
jgi:hypothetical protein